MRARIRERMEATGKDQYAVAEEAGLSRTSVWAYLTGRTDTIRRSNLEKIAPVLGCTVEELTGEARGPASVDDGDYKDALPNLSGTQPISLRKLPQGSLAIEGIIGAWAAASSKPITRIPIMPDPRYPTAQQSAYLVIGDAWKETGISDGSVVTISKMPPRDGDMVAVQLTRQNGERSVTISEWYDGEAVDLEDGDWTSEIVGVVVRESRVF